MFYLFDVTRTTAKNYGSLDRQGHQGDGGSSGGGNGGPRKPPVSSSAAPRQKRNGEELVRDGAGVVDSGGNVVHGDDDRTPLLIPGLQRRDGGEGRGDRRDPIPPPMMDVDEALERLGMGVFQARIMIAAGLVLATDSMEVVILSLLSRVAKAHWDGPAAAVASSSSNYVHEGDVYGNDGDQDALLGTVVLPAALLGAVLWGVLGDVLGRRTVFAVTAALVSIFGVATAFVTSYRCLLAARVMVAFGVSGLTVPFDVCAEILPPKLRGKLLTVLQTFRTLGGLLVHLALQQQDQEAIATPDDAGGTVVDRWRWIAGLCALPCVVATILALTVLPESPRWLLARGEADRALQVLRDAALSNGKDPLEVFPDGVILYSLEQEEVAPWPLSSSSILPSSLFGPVGQVFNLCSSGWMSITSALWAVYFFKAFLEHGAVSMAVTVFSNDDRQQDYQALFSASAELLALILVFVTVDRLGRTATQCVAYACGGVICLILALLEDYDPSVNPNLLLLLAFSAHMFVNAGTSTTWIATTEVLATAIRTTGHGTAHAFARGGGALSTYLLGRIYSTPTVGLLLFLTGLWTASAASKLPETDRKEMGVVHDHRRQQRRRRQRRDGLGSHNHGRRRRKGNDNPNNDNQEGLLVMTS
jgi:MFS family permease